MPDLFPVFDVPADYVTPKPETSLRFKRGLLFDFARGDFVRDGANQVVTCDGYISWKTWCEKVMHTQRFAYLGYSNDIGVECEEALSNSDPEAVMAYLERTITEALLADPYGRTSAVKDFRYQWESDTLYVACTVTNVEGNNAEIEVRYPS